jgi:hypothetical protein
VAPDDQRFLMMTLGAVNASDAQPRFVLVQNFFEELKRRGPN